MYDTRTALALPIQSSFDIAQGRSTIRTLINLRRWPVIFNARAATAFTALGELIMLMGISRVTPVYVEILEQESGRGIMFQCGFELSTETPSQWNTWCQQLQEAADELAVETQTTRLLLKARVHFEPRKIATRDLAKTAE